MNKLEKERDVSEALDESQESTNIRLVVTFQLLYRL